MAFSSLHEGMCQKWNGIERVKHAQYVEDKKGAPEKSQFLKFQISLQ